MTDDTDPAKAFFDKLARDAAVSIPPPPKPTCGNCRFAVPSMQLDQLGCTRFPPQIVLLPPNQLVTQFPMMKSNQLCGEWQSKLDS